MEDRIPYPEVLSVPRLRYIRTPIRVQLCRNPQWNPWALRVVPCGKHCEVCQSKRAREWRRRITDEINRTERTWFFTLTYRELPQAEGFKSTDRQITRDVQRWFKRLRANNPDTVYRYFYVIEYGPKTDRPHVHGFLHVYGPARTKRIVGQDWNLGFTKFHLLRS